MLNRTLFLVFFLFFSISISAQKSVVVKNKTDFKNSDIDSVIQAYKLAVLSISSANNFLQSEFKVGHQNKINWVKHWNDQEELVKWFGAKEEPHQITRIKRRIKKMNRRASRKAHLMFHAYNRKGLCRGSRHAWTIPRGLVKIHICQQFMYKPFKLWSKIFIHELAHESGILFHRRIYWRQTALRAAELEPKIASGNPENYAFYIMEFWRE